jgi:Fur family ferric uptake transcriptional regulator
MTSRSAGYNTRQRQAILEYLATLEGVHFTADELTRYFAASPTPIGRTTVYRHLNRLVSEGTIQRLPTGRQSADCYQYLPQPEPCSQHFHLRCDHCGTLYHVDCDELAHVATHIATSHDFALDTASTIFRGTCTSCAPATRTAPVGLNAN